MDEMYHGFESTVKALFNRFFFLKKQGLLPDWIEVDEENWKVVNKKSNETYQLRNKKFDLPLKDGRTEKLFVVYSIDDYIDVATNYEDWKVVVQGLVDALNSATDYISERLNSGESAVEVDQQTIDIIHKAYLNHVNKDVHRITMRGDFTTVEEAIEFMKSDTYFEVPYYLLDRAVLGLVVDFVDKDSGFTLKSKDAMIHMLATLLWATSGLWDRLE